MKAFAVLEQKPIPCRTVSVRFKEEVAPAVSISSIHQPSPNKSTVNSHQCSFTLFRYIEPEPTHKIIPT